MQRKTTISLVLFISLLFAGLPLSRALNNPPNMTDNISVKDNQQTVFIPILQQDENDTLKDRPILVIEKSINASPIEEGDEDLNTFLLRPNDWIRVNVTIANVGNQSAYNLTIIDPSFEDWAVGSLNLTTQRYVQVDVNATIFYFYYFQTKIVGNFILGETSVSYINGTGTEYYSSSQRFRLAVEALEEEYELVADLWLNILYFCLGVVGILGAIILVDRYVIQKPDGRKSRRRRFTLTDTQKSKRDEKKKIEKR
ncbi:MAG: hypothetical protein KGD64_13775 [Candidatus Heimdallarchaeota archaeon]|nr:hypothetical protein [Candidatus Heimdallarchaeota archaeon]